jgi:hypothetical protein
MSNDRLMMWLMWLMWVAIAILFILDFWLNRNAYAAICLWAAPLMIVSNASTLYHLGNPRQRSLALIMTAIGVATAALPLVYTLFPGLG